MSLATALDNRLADLRWAWRSICRSPGAASLAVLSLALGIGANTAIFSLVNAVLLKLLPVRAPHELYLLATTDEGRGFRTSWNYPDYLAFRDRTTGFSGLAAGSGVSLLGMQLGEGRDAAELVRHQFVSGNYFDVLGVRPASGRLFGEAEDRALGGAPFAVLSYGYWQARFGGDPAVVGRTVRLNGCLLTVVGVAARGFKGIDPTAEADLFVPMVMHGEVRHVPDGVWNTRHYWWFNVIGRVPAGTPAGPIASQLTSVYHAQEEEERKANPRMRQGGSPASLQLVPAATGHSFARRILEKPLLVLMALVGLVLLIACANVANIMLARGAVRQREVAIRLAVGAGRGRIASQLLTESVLVSALGGAAGVALAYFGIRIVLARFLPTTGWGDLSLDVSPDLGVLGFTLGVSLLIGVLAGLAPGWQATRPELLSGLKDDVPGRAGGSRVVLRRLLVVAQVALSLLLVIGAALFARSLGNLRSLEAGFRRDRTLIAFVDPGRNGYKGQRLQDFYERLRGEVERMAGVRSASLAAITPLGGMRWNEDFAVEGRQFQEGEQRYVDCNAVGPRYFETVGIPLLLGREFADRDKPTSVPEPPERLAPPGEQAEAPGPRFVVVSDGFARKFLADGSPLGRRLSFSEEFEPGRAYEVIGVAGDAHYFDLREAAEPMVYVVSGRGFPGAQHLCIRTTGQTAGLVDAIRKAVTAIDPAVPLLRTRTIEQEIDTNIVQQRLLATLAGFFGLLALVLSCVGLYGVISYVVARRTREIGIRLALGAQRSRVAALVLADAGVLVAAGAGVGLAASLALSKLVRNLLYGVSPHDPATMAGALGVLLAVTALAVLVPLRRAMAVQPGEALRYE